MSDQPTPAQAELLLKLYDLRRETELRKARDWCSFEFFPESVDDIVQVFSALGTPENRYIRQVTSYWEMCAAFIVQGLVPETLFFTGSGEMPLLWAKFKPHMKKLREIAGFPEMMQNIEKVCEGSETTRARVAAAEKWLEARRVTENAIAASRS
jgi:hypothetical protein